jgi:hypothetical protein
LVWTAEEFGSPVLCGDVKNGNFLFGNTVDALVLTGWIETYVLLLLESNLEV